MPIQWQEVSRWLRDTTRIAVRESKELARKGKVQYEILALRNQVTDALTELGSVVYNLARKRNPQPIMENTQVQELLSRLQELERSLKRKEREKQTRKYE